MNNFKTNLILTLMMIIGSWLSGAVVITEGYILINLQSLGLFIGNFLMTFSLTTGAKGWMQNVNSNNSPGIR